MQIIITALAATMLLSSCGKTGSGKFDEQKTKSTLIMEDIRPPGLNGENEKDQMHREIDTSINQLPAGNKQHRPMQPPALDKNWDKKIIKTANLEIEISDFKKYYSELRDKVRNHGGYIAEEEQTRDDYKIQTRVSIKVPVDQFENALTVITDKVEKINERKISSQDVTTEYVDTRSRMESKKQVRQRYLDLLKQARNMEEILNVQSEINDIQEEIESATGRIEYLGHASTFSSINLVFFQVLNPQAKSDDNPSYGNKIIHAFKTGWNWVSDIIVGMISIWPFFIILAILVAYFKRMKWSRVKQAS